jgi:hypothetical protein
MQQGLQYQRWDCTRKELGTVFRLRKGKREARAYITTHPTAWWELRLDVDGNLIESKAFKEQHRLLETIAEWRARLVGAGWQDPPAMETTKKGRGV